MSEHSIQNEIRNELCDRGLFFRANCGQAWTGSEFKRLPDGSLLIRDPRPFKTGLPNGFSDLFGIVPGGRFAAIEVKGPRGVVSPDQTNFIAAVQRYGGCAGVARSVADAIRIINQIPPPP